MGNKKIVKNDKNPYQESLDLVRDFKRDFDELWALKLKRAEGKTGGTLQQKKEAGVRSWKNTEGLN